MIIGFTGRKRSGKDTAAQVAVQEGFVQMSFAAPLKDMLRKLLHYQGARPHEIQAMIEGDLKEIDTPLLGGRSPRYAMQRLGTEWGRDLIGEDFWADTLINASRIYNRVVVSDVRFPNEVRVIKEAGGVVLRVHRPGLAANDDHPSEKLIDKLVVDHEIANDGSLEEFNSKVQGMIRNILCRTAAA